MGNINQIQLPSGDIYSINDTYKTGVYTVIGTQTASTGSWTGALHGVSALYDGLTIMYYLPYAGSGNATLNLTLDDGTTTGAVDCYYSTSRLTTHYGKGCNIIMTYHSAGSIKIDGTATTNNRWIANANYVDGNTHYYLRRSQTDILAGANKIFPYTIIMQIADGRWESIVTSSSTGTSKARNTHGFRLGQMLFMYANATYAENDRVANGNLWDQHTDACDHRYSFNTANNATSGTTANKPIYIVGALNASDGLFYLDTTWWTQTLPTTDNGKIYIYVGDAYDYYRFDYSVNHPMYWYKNGALRQFTQDSATVNGLTVQTAVPTNAKFTDTTYANGTGITIGTGNAINHSNSVTAQTTQKVYPIKIDAQGHISAYGTSPTTLSGYGITDAKIASGVITLGSNTITPLTASSTLDATKLSGTIPSSCYTNTKNTAGSTDTSSKIFLIGATSQAANPQTYSQDTAYVDTNGHVYSNSKQVVNLSDTQALTNKTYNGYTLAAACAKAVVTSVDTSASLPTSNAVKTFVEGKGYVTTDTKNTAGSTDTSSKIFLIGATSQAANPQTYSDNEVYTTSGVLTTKSIQVGGGSATMQYNTTTQAIDFIFN